MDNKSFFIQHHRHYILGNCKVFEKKIIDNDMESFRQAQEVHIGKHSEQHTSYDKVDNWTFEFFCKSIEKTPSFRESSVAPEFVGPSDDLVHMVRFEKNLV